MTLRSRSFVQPISNSLSQICLDTSPALPSFSSPPAPTQKHAQVLNDDTATIEADLDSPSPTPQVQCHVRARIPTVCGAETFMYLYQNDLDDREHLAITFGRDIRSASLDRRREGETEMDRMVRGAYVGRLRPGQQTSGLLDKPNHSFPREQTRQLQTSVAAPAAVDEDLLPLIPIVESTLKQQGSHHLEVNDKEDKYTLDGKAPLIYIHSECYTGDVLRSTRCRCRNQLDEAAQLMGSPAHNGGIIVYLRQEGKGLSLGKKLRDCNLQELAKEIVEPEVCGGYSIDNRSIDVAAAILLDLGCGGERIMGLLTHDGNELEGSGATENDIRIKNRVVSRILGHKELRAS